MIDLTRVKEIERAMNKAVKLEPKGTKIIYWRGETDFDPKGRRDYALKMARNLYAIGKVSLVQKRHKDGDYSYIMEVR